jgi:hypothetical protein
MADSPRWASVALLTGSPGTSPSRATPPSAHATHTLIESTILRHTRCYDIYYKYEQRRLPACKTLCHALLHIADCIGWLGPMWSYGQWYLEQVGRLSFDRSPLEPVLSYCSATFEIRISAVRPHPSPHLLRWTFCIFPTPFVPIPISVQWTNHTRKFDHSPAEASPHSSPTFYTHFGRQCHQQREYRMQPTVWLVLGASRIAHKRYDALFR